jgi:hypothetical protein
MSWRNVLFALLIVAGAWQGAHAWLMRPAHPPDGLIAPDDPEQVMLDNAPPTRLGRWELHPRAHYDITARILSREDYHFDVLSSLIPEDLALGWGPMSDNRILRSFDITQGARFYSWTPRASMPISRQEAIEHSANTHVIPIDAVVARELKQLRVGQVVHLSGLLVDGVRDDGVSFHTSLTRSDTGPGACEVLLVTEMDAR